MLGVGEGSCGASLISEMSLDLFSRRNRQGGNLEMV